MPERETVDERYFLRILLGTTVSPKSSDELSRIYHIPRGFCTAILEYLERRGYVSNVVTLFGPDGHAVRYYLRTERRVRPVTADDARMPLSPPLA